VHLWRTRPARCPPRFSRIMVERDAAGQCEIEFLHVAQNPALWETGDMKAEQTLAELLAKADELQRQTEKLIEQSRKLQEEIRKTSQRFNRKGEDLHQAAARIVREATEDR
jgi:predicted ATP-grasp superfamily ATP-dependent carboligase